MQQIMGQLNGQLTGAGLANAQNQNINNINNLDNLFNVAGMSRMPDAAGMQGYFSMFTRNPAGGFSVDLSGLSPEVASQLVSKAREDVSADGFWGVEKTSDRIFNFAQALTGGDSRGMERMRQVVERAFESVGRMFGGLDNMPEISRDTHRAVMQRFDEFAAATEENRQTSGLTGTA
jgi:hypothetical protein